jgi:hypothetical protein
LTKCIIYGIFNTNKIKFCGGIGIVALVIQVPEEEFGKNRLEGAENPDPVREMNKEELSAILVLVEIGNEALRKMSEYKQKLAHLRPEDPEYKGLCECYRNNCATFWSTRNELQGYL